MTDSEQSPRDVRMRGFAHRHSVGVAWDWIERHASLLEAETVSHANACGRVLAGNVTAPLNVPAFDRSAMDGFAVRAAETDGAGDYNPLSFRIIGQSLPGQPFAGMLATGTAVRIMTGAPLPQAADAVVPAEYATEAKDCVELTAAVSPGKHVGRVGEDIAEGQPVFSAGRQLRPQDAGLLASLGIADVAVVRRPRVRIVITGNELVSPGEPRGPFQIFEANSSTLRGLIERDGGVLESQQNLPDQKDAIREALDATGGRCGVGLRRLQRGSRRPCPGDSCRSRHARFARLGDAAIQPGGHGANRFDNRVFVAGQSCVVPLCLRFFRGPSDSAARRTRSRLAAPLGRTSAGPQNGVRDWTIGLLPGDRPQRQRGTHRPQRSFDFVFHDEGQRIRDRARRPRRLRPRRNRQGLSLRLNKNHGRENR